MAELASTVILLATMCWVLGSVVRREWGPALARFSAGVLASFVVSNVDELTGWLGDTGGHPSEPAGAEHQASNEPSLWLPLALGAGGLAVCFGLYGLWNLLQRRRGRRVAQRAADAALQTRRHAIEVEHDEVRDAYAAYLCDVLAVLDRPALDDVTVPRTAALLHAVDTAADARQGSDLDAYRQAVSALKTAWRAADGHARRTGARYLPAEDRVAIAKARRLFEKALDERGSQHERMAAYGKARALLDGVLTVPRQAVAAVKHQTRPAPADAEDTTA
ncbi:hypothetical protein [Streptomyces sp. NPDC059881]|uniref:hypothetical protein n=1 Tax=Streptomyces sp. NPDC059881 TaxID=3346986 RepID=UPI00365087E1